MSNFLENCRLYIVWIYVHKLRKEYRFYVAAENKSNAIDLVEKEVNKVMGQTYVITKVSKLPNKEQVIDFYQD